MHLMANGFVTNCNFMYQWWIHYWNARISSLGMHYKALRSMEMGMCVIEVANVGLAHL